MDVRLQDAGNQYRVHLETRGDRCVATVHRVAEDGTESNSTLSLDVQELTGGEFHLGGPAGPRAGYAVSSDGVRWVEFAGVTWRLEGSVGASPTRSRPRPGAVSAPMPGQVLRTLVEVGDRVEKGQPLMVVEAMKMQLEITAPHAGQVVSLAAGPGDQVAPGVPLVDIASDEDDG